MLTLEQLKELQKKYNLSYNEISEKSGVPLTTVQKIFGGFTETPRRKTLDMLETAFPKLDVWNMSGDDSMSVAEVEFEYRAKELSDKSRAKELLYSKSQGDFNVDDYYIISEAWRIELIDGVIYDMAASVVDHQSLVGGIHAQLLKCADDHDDLCMPLVSPVDVQLNKDNKTMVQPDVVVVCDFNKIKKKVVYGTPEFVLEVISPSSRSKDMVKKRDKYRDAGCKEYWLIDPEDESIKVFGFESGADGLYNFDQKVPVQISNGECEVDFSVIKRRMKRMAEVGLV